MKVTTVGELLEWLRDKPAESVVHVEVHTGPATNGPRVRHGALTHAKVVDGEVYLASAPETVKHIYSAGGFPTLIEEEEPKIGGE